MSKITIPPQALEAGARAVFRTEYCREPYEWDRFDANQMALARKYVRNAFEAMVAAWEGATMQGPHSSGHGPSKPTLILPLPTENSDAEA